MDEMEILEALDYDYESIQEQRTEALEELLERRDMKQLKTRMEELNEFDVAEFLSEIEDNRMPMVFRLLSKSTAADVFANLEAPDQERIINSVTDSELAALVEGASGKCGCPCHAHRYPLHQKPDKPVSAFPGGFRRQHHDLGVRGFEKVHERKGIYRPHTPYRCG